MFWHPIISLQQLVLFNITNLVFYAIYPTPGYLPAMADHQYRRPPGPPILREGWAGGGYNRPCRGVCRGRRSVMFNIGEIPSRD